jgi:general stress protein YciG
MTAESKRRRPLTEEHKRKIVATRRKNGSYKQSEEHKKKISLSNTGRKHTPESISRMKLAHIGLNTGKHWKLSYDDKKRRSIARKGIPLSPEHKEKVIKTLVHIKGRKLSIEHRMAISNGHKGEKSHFWKGGKAKIYKYTHITNIKYRLWREAVFARDKWTCQDCGKQGGELNAHHIQKWSEFPELRYVMKNGITVCVKCHKERHKKYYSGNNYAQCK